MFQNNVRLALTPKIGINCERRSIERSSSIDSKALGAPMLLSDRQNCLLGALLEHSMIEMAGVGVAPRVGPHVNQCSTEGGIRCDGFLADKIGHAEIDIAVVKFVGAVLELLRAGKDRRG
jgi:hypothetical protein